MRDFTLQDIKRLIRVISDGAPPTGDNFIDNRYEQHNVKFNHYEPYYRLFYHLADMLQPSLTVELGGWQGTAAAHFASGHPEGIVVTIDHHSDPGDDENQRLMEEAVNHYDNLVYLKGWTWDVKETVEIIGRGIDILFIDSWHQYEYAMRDWNDYSPMLSDVALVICDDILAGDGPVISQMDRFWAELPGEKFLDESLRDGIPMGFMRYDRLS